MMQTSTGVGTARKAPSFPSLLQNWLQTSFLRREVEPRRQRIKALQREALRSLTSRQRASDLGDCLEFGATDKCMAQVLRELRLDDVRVLALDTQLTPELRQRHWLRKVSVVRIAGKVSTADVLRSVEPLIVEQAVILFDAWSEHEHAFEEFLRACPGMTARRLPSDSTVAQSVVVTRALTV